MSAHAQRLTVVMIGSALLAAPLALVAAPAASARPADAGITLTSAQLTEFGFPKTPNTTAWDPGTAALPTSSAAQWQDVVITGKAPNYTDPGQLLTMSRFVPSDLKGSGQNKELNITTVVQANRTFAMHFQLGMPGTYGYSVGYMTTSASPEYISFQFQFTTTGNGKAAPSSGSSSAVTLGPKKLTEGGFTRKPNLVGWGGTATLSTHRAPAGTPVTIKGTAPKELEAGTVLTLERFTATDKQGSGSFSPVGNVTTTVKADGTFALTFEINEKGRYGYTLGASHSDEWIGIEFQLKTT
jgi:hypothetical protein